MQILKDVIMTFIQETTHQSISSIVRIYLSVIKHVLNPSTFIKGNLIQIRVLYFNEKSVKNLQLFLPNLFR